MEKLTEKDISFTFICPMVWDEMPESANGRFCAGCRKEIFDLSNCSIGEVRELQRKHGPICGSIKVVRAAAVAASLTAAACQDSGTTRTTGTPIQKKPAQEIRVPGYICLPEESEGGKGE